MCRVSGVELLHIGRPREMLRVFRYVRLRTLAEFDPVPEDPETSAPMAAIHQGRRLGEEPPVEEVVDMLQLYVSEEVPLVSVRDVTAHWDELTASATELGHASTPVWVLGVACKSVSGSGETNGRYKSLRIVRKLPAADAGKS